MNKGNVAKWGANLKRQSQYPDPNTSARIKELLSVCLNNTGLHLFSLDTIAPVSEEDFYFFSAGEAVGQCFVWVDCVQGPMSRPPPTDRHDSAVMSQRQRASPKNTIFRGCKQVYGACTPSERMNVSVVAMPPRNFKNNDYVCSSPHSPPTPECYSGDSWENKRNRDQLQGEASLIKEKGRANTGLLLQTLPMGIISFEGGIWHCGSNEMLYQIRGRDATDVNVRHLNLFFFFNPYLLSHVLYHITDPQAEISSFFGRFNTHFRP